MHDATKYKVVNDQTELWSLYGSDNFTKAQWACVKKTDDPSCICGTWELLSVPWPGGCGHVASVVDVVCGRTRSHENPNIFTPCLNTKGRRRVCEFYRLNWPCDKMECQHGAAVWQEPWHRRQWLEIQTAVGDFRDFSPSLDGKPRAPHFKSMSHFRELQSPTTCYNPSHSHGSIARRQAPRATGAPRAVFGRGR